MNDHNDIGTARSIFRNIGIFGGAQCFTVLAALVRGKAAAVLVGSAGVGLTALFNTVATFFANLTSLGIANSAVRTLSEAVATGDAATVEAGIRRIRTWGVLTAAAGATLMLLGSPLLAYAYRDAEIGAGSFAALAVVVAMTLLSGCELAIMKACRHVRSLAIVTILAAVVSVAFVIPFYAWMGMRGVIWAVVVSSFVSAGQTVVVGWRLHPVAPAWPSPTFWPQSRPMVMLGLALVASGIVASGVELCLQGFFTAVASLSVLGLYKAGYQLSVTYTGMIFAAVGSDFYPRLAALHGDTERRDLAVNRQIAVLLAVVVPMVAVFECLVPWLLPLLFSAEFSSVETMVRWAALALPIKAVALPIAYLPLAMGKPLHYFLLESTSWLLLAAFVVAGYVVGGLDAAGAGILLSQAAELCVQWLFCRRKYGYRLSLRMGIFKK